MNENRNNGCYKNLEAQINSIMKNTNEGSIKTRYRYLEAEKRCMEYTAEKWGLKKVQNFSSKHLVSYVSFMKEKGLSPAMIKTEIAGIRWFHRHSGSKNILIDNSKLDLQQREYGKVNRAWLPQEVKSAVAIGKYYGRMDFAFCVQFSYLYSTRISESCNLRINELEKCLTTSELKITGKGGRTRYVQMTTAEQKALIQEALNYAKEHNLSKTDRLFVDNRKGGVQRSIKSIENFLSNHKDKFIESDRQKYIVGNRVLSETLTMHGLRSSYSQNLYKELKENNPRLSDKEIRLRISEALGHGRLDVFRRHYEA